MSCRELAAASVQFDASRALVLIVDLAESVAGIPVCRTHVATRNAPMGWTLQDQRTFIQQRLGVDDERPVRHTPMIHSRTATFAPTVAGPSVRPSLRRAAPVSGFPWDDDPTDPGGASALPPELDDATTPLLRRAFRQ